MTKTATSTMFLKAALDSVYDLVVQSLRLNSISELKECLLKIHRLSLMLCQLRFSDSLNKDYDENIHLPGLWLDTDGFKKERG